MNSRAPRLCWLTLSAFLFAATPAVASHFTLRPDGTGDYPTISSVFVAIVEQGARADTIILEPGFYDEIVKDADCAGRLVYARAGAAATHVRGFEPNRCSSYGPRVVGVTIDTHFGCPTSNDWFWTGNCAGWTWEDCVFMDGFSGYGSFNAPVHGCTFHGPVEFHGFNDLADCTFDGAPAFFENGIGYVTVTHCTFRGPAEDLVVANPRDESGINFRDCTFSGGDNGIRILSRNLAHQSLDVIRCRFERLAGSAVEYVYDEAGAPLQDRFYLNLSSSRFSDVGRALRARSSLLISLSMDDDTIATAHDAAIDATVRFGAIHGLKVDDVTGDGVRFTIQNFNPYQYSEEVATFDLRDSHLHNCSGSGIRIEQAPNPVWNAQQIAIRNSTIEANGGPGISFEGAQPTVTGCLVRGNGGVGILAIPAGAAPACSLSSNTVVENGKRGIQIKSTTRLPAIAVDHDLVTNNRGGGIAVLGAFRGAVALNDVFANGGAAFSGPMPHGVNLEVDPLYCGLLEGDFHVRQDSPCGPLGPFGIIGAFGIGCLPPAPIAETIRLRSPLGIGPNPTRGPVTFAWASGVPLDAIELFDVQGRRRWNATGEALHSGAMRWNGLGLGGERLPAGIYLVRWRAGDQQGSSRLVLLDP